MNSASNQVLEFIQIAQTNDGQDRAQEVNKKRVAEHFSAACGNYDQYAQVQKQIAEVNFELLSQVIAGRSKFSVDLGCGTGLHTGSLAKMSDNCLAIDISHGMLKVAQINNADVTTFTNKAILYCSGDADSLPLQSQSIDVLHSSMALQWCSSPSFVIAEIIRVLSTGGSAQLAIMLDSSLYELRDAWENIGITPRINNFFSQKQWLQATQDLQIEQINKNSNVKINIQQKVRSFTEWHSSSLDMLRALKLIGAATKYNSKQISENRHLQLSPVAASTAISKQELLELDKQMQPHQCGLSEQYRQRKAGYKAKGKPSLPLTYQILFLTIQKTQS
jgi:malonyl-CoA O-methyltransferase